jgi:hypothetical protein
MGPLAPRCGAQVTLAWNPSRGAGVAGYNLCWGTHSGIYLYTNYCLYSQTSQTLSNLATNEVFFFAVQALASNGTVSVFSNEAEYTNGAPAATNAPPVTTNVPPVVTNSGPVVVPGPFSPPPTNTITGGGTNGSGTNSGTNSSTNITQSTLWGIPPSLGMVLSNGQTYLAINGTVGATLTIMGATNDMSADSWGVVTNVTVSNIAFLAASNEAGQPQDLLDVAFVPGTQTLALVGAKGAPCQYFRVVMPYDYIILAGQVLPAKGYTPRLILVNLPGIVCDDACYVNETSSFIHYTHTHYVLQLIPSSTTIRSIATALANSLELDWTSASEFTYTNGMGQILATVIETEAPASDPVAGQSPPGPPIVIDF